MSWPDDTESVSGPRYSVTTSSDANRNSVASSSLWSTSVTSFEFDADPSPPFSQNTQLGNVVRSETGKNNDIGIGAESLFFFGGGGTFFGRK